MPVDSGPSKASEPPSWAGMPRCSAYQRDNASGSRAFRNTPPNPIAFAIRQLLAPSFQLPASSCGRQGYWLPRDETRARYSASRSISSSFGLCLASRGVRGALSSITRAGLGWPTRSRALAFTALVAENRAGLRFVTARLSMLYDPLERKRAPGSFFRNGVKAPDGALGHMAGTAGE